MRIPVLEARVHKPKVKSEHLEQAEFVSWMRKTYPEHRIFAIANGGLRSKSVAMSLKVEGVVKGVPDLMVPSLKLFIEMKRTNNSVVSEEQHDWIKYLNSVGYIAKVCYGKDDAVDLVKKLLT